MDDRFKDKMGWISEWVRKELKVIPDRRGVLSNVTHNFWIE
jgi:hypothetical protein